MSLFRVLGVQTKIPLVNTRGRVTVTDWKDRTTLVAIMANQVITPHEELGEVLHTVTHTIAQKGAPVAVTGERLTLGTRRFFITKVLNPGELNKWTLYTCVERFDDE